MHIEISKFLLQLGIVLISAKFFGVFFSRVLKIPTLLGELLAGVIIAPVNFSSFKPQILFELFSKESEYFHILKVIGEIAIGMLLFYSGMETDKKKFFKYFVKAFIIGLGGVIIPLILCSGYIFIWLKSTGSDYTFQEILFSGAIASATSVGITATILADFGKLETIFGTAILVAAVVDDVLGLIVLSVAFNVEGNGVNTREIILVTIKAFGMWFLVGLGAFAIVPLLNKYLVKKFESSFLFSISIALAFLAGFLCEKVRLSAIVGTYVVGLAIAQTELAKKIEHLTLSVTEFLIPFFFFKIGLLIELNLFSKIYISGTIFVLLAIIGKFIGCGFLSFMLKINMKDSILVGTGMVPRGEVGLIIASIALEKKIISSEIYNIAIFMVFFSTIFAIIALTILLKKFYPEAKLVAEL